MEKSAISQRLREFDGTQNRKLLNRRAHLVRGLHIPAERRYLHGVWLFVYQDAHRLVPTGESFLVPDDNLATIISKVREPPFQDCCACPAIGLSTCYRWHLWRQ
ncbi:hypothetical protein ACFC1B_05090 [Streptomyces xiamenensis]|uniref:hypothetical protein n=1 Tax=Streptomyces xiamenensis TaxID=408015 RepID=UPI0035D9EFD2